jgi:Nucleotidyl transferase
MKGRVSRAFFTVCACSVSTGDHLYRMDYQDFVLKHRQSGADITVSALPMDEERATAFGVMKIDNTGRIIDFAEKPKGELLDSFKVDTTVLGLDKKRCASVALAESMSACLAVRSLHRQIRLEPGRRFPLGLDGRPRETAGHGSIEPWVLAASACFAPMRLLQCECVLCSSSYRRQRR